MYAIDINGEIKTHNNLPKSFGNVIGGFDTISDEQAQAFGFYSVVVPQYDSRTENLGNIYFDSDNNVFTYPVNIRIWEETLSELKITKINSLKLHTNSLLQSTDWYITRKFERNIDVPQDIQDARNEILLNHNTTESEINALTTKKSVVSYEFK